MNIIDTALRLLLVNAVGATLLAMVVWIVTRFLRRPAVAHALWLLVLLKLVTPPLIEIAILPAGLGLPSPPEIGETLTAIPTAYPEVIPSALPDGTRLATVDPAESEPFIHRIGVAGSVFGVWLAGCLMLLGLTLVRGVRFQRHIRDAVSAPDALLDRADVLARALRLRRRPPLRLVKGRMSPALWFSLRSLVVLLPQGLLERLRDEERDAVVAHELAHADRRDHWVRLLEIASVALFWWHPVVWWARQNLRHAEERCCDMRVVEALPSHGKHYARGLLKTVEFMAVDPVRVPAAASGIGPAQKLEERLNMILKHRVSGRLTALQQALLVATLPALLLLLPTASDRAAEPGAEPTPQNVNEPTDRDTSEAAQRIRDEIRAIERQALDLEEELRQLEQRKRAVAGEQLELEQAQTLRQLEIELRQREQAGRSEAAEVLRLEMQELAELYRVKAEAYRLETLQRTEAGEIEAELRRLRLEAVELEDAGLVDEARENSDASRKLRQELAAVEAYSRALELETVREHVLQEVYEREREERRSWTIEESVALESDRREEARARQEYEKQAQAVWSRNAKLEIEKLTAEAEEAEAAGRAEEAREHRERIRLLTKTLEGR